MSVYDAPGALPEAYTPSGQPPAGPHQLEAGSAASLSPPLAPRESKLDELRDLPPGGREGAGYAELIEAAIARADVPALAYELGRADATGAEDLSRDLAEAALRRLGVTGGGEDPADRPES